MRIVTSWLQQQEVMILSISSEADGLQPKMLRCWQSPLTLFLAPSVLNTFAKHA